MNARSEKFLSAVHPELARRARIIAARLATYGYPVEIGQGLRTVAEQNVLFSQGRTRKGRIITKAAGGFSPHNFGCAVDFLLAKPVPLVLANGTTKLDVRHNPILTLFPDYTLSGGKVMEHPLWKLLSLEIETVGLVSGYNWKSFQDKPHVEIPELDYTHGVVFRALYKQGGMSAVWKAADAVFDKYPVKEDATKNFEI
jgi:peptidoglycan L-alanyl-D-glutamate endopeptidase CwlK